MKTRKIIFLLVILLVYSTFRQLEQKVISRYECLSHQLFTHLNVADEKGLIELVGFHQNRSLTTPVSEKIDFLTSNKSFFKNN